MPFSHFIATERGEKYENISDLHLDLKRIKTDTEDLQKQINFIN